MFLLICDYDNRLMTCHVVYVSLPQLTVVMSLTDRAAWYSGGGQSVKVRELAGGPQWTPGAQ